VSRVSVVRAGAARAALAVSVLLAACSEGSYEKRDGQWLYDGNPIEVREPNRFTPLGRKGDALSAFARDSKVGYYRGSAIDGSDGPSFVALDAQYARDKAHAYFCDTYRKGQEYYLTRHNHIVTIDGVDLGTFRVWQPGYARDTARLYYEGAHVPVRDLASFELLEHDFQRDRVTGYYMRRPIAGSAGRSFVVLDAGYARDSVAVYFAHYRTPDPELLNTTVRVPGALTATFVVKGGGYAVDARHVFHNGNPIAEDVAGFAVLDMAYAKTSTAVFYDGTPVAGADAATFVTLGSETNGADAQDARRRYRRGKPAS
jgi:hypothetical protein